MSSIEFEAFPKIPRLNREMVVTEKLDGTNAAVVITEDGEIGAQSRTRLITPEADNYGFAGWVQRNAEALVSTLGPGRHFGEWWGSGIQRRYGLAGGDKRFSLFNTARWLSEYTPLPELSAVPGLGVVPLMYVGPFSHEKVNEIIGDLREYGSSATEKPFMKPEGVVVYLPAARSMFKVMVEHDDVPKGEVEKPWAEKFPEFAKLLNPSEAS